MRRPKPILIEPIEASPTDSTADSNKSTDGKKAVASLRQNPAATKPNELKVEKVAPAPKTQTFPLLDQAAQNRAKRVAATLQHYLDNPESATERKSMGSHARNSALRGGYSAGLIVTNALMR